MSMISSLFFFSIPPTRSVLRFQLNSVIAQCGELKSFS